MSSSPLNRSLSNSGALKKLIPLKGHMYNILIVDVTRPGVTYNIEVRWFDKIRDVKLILRRLTNEHLTKHHLFLPRGSKELSNSLTLHDAGIVKGGCKLRLVVESSFNGRASVLPFNSAAEVSEEINDLIDKTREGLTSMKPTKVDEFDASGGVYFIRKGRGEKVSVFKPQNEEPGMPDNPHGRAQDPLREFFSPGQGCFRELAAYIFDVNNFVLVPPTSVVLCDHSSFATGPKVGSLQKYVNSYSIFGDLGHSELQKISDFEIQKIALFDMRILNCDRNSGNILICHKTEDEGDYIGEDDNENDLYQLIPIDHGYSMPSRLRVSDIDWCWLQCEQVKHPVCKEIIEYMKSLDIDEIIAETLDQVQLSDEHVYLLHCVHHFLLMAMDLGFTLYEIALFFARDFNDEEKPSRFETIFSEIEEFTFRYFDVKISSHGNSISSNKSSKGSAVEAPNASPLGGAVNSDGMTLKRLSSLCGYEVDYENVKKLGSPIPESPLSIDKLDKPPTNKINTTPVNDCSPRSFYESEYRLPSTPNLLPQTPLSRIASFSAFGSDNVYNKKDLNTRNPTKALRTRNSLLQSPEFKKFRLDHTLSKFRALLKREKSGSFDKTFDS